MRDQRKQRCRGAAGFSYIEVMLAAAVLAIGVLSQASLSLTSLSQAKLNRSYRLALGAAEQQLELLKSHPFEQLFTDFSGSQSAFDVDGLSAVAADPDGRVGAIVFPTVGSDLREDVLNPRLGMPYDLDGDGAVDAAPKNTNYVRMPVIVEVRWRGTMGDQTLRVTSLIERRE